LLYWQDGFVSILLERHVFLVGNHGNRMNCFLFDAKKNYAARVRGLASAFVGYPQLALWARRISPASLACIHICLVFFIFFMRLPWAKMPA